MNAPDAAAEEAGRALENGANAIQLAQCQRTATRRTAVPTDLRRHCKSGKPILLHPARTREMPTIRPRNFQNTKFAGVLGWPYETGVTLARLVFSGIMDRYPDLKVIAHHLGGVIPYLEGRVAHSFDQLGVRTFDEDYGALLNR